MKKIFQTTFFTFLFMITISSLFGQKKVVNDLDFQLKETLYNKYKKEVQRYDKSDFDALFFEFFTKQNDENLLLTKDEYYTYTIKIAAYSEKLGLLYKDQKEVSQRTKKEWFDKKYSDYLESKKP